MFDLVPQVGCQDLLQMEEVECITTSSRYAAGPMRAEQENTRWLVIGALLDTLGGFQILLDYQGDPIDAVLHILYEVDNRAEGGGLFDPGLPGHVQQPTKSPSKELF